MCESVPYRLVLREVSLFSTYPENTLKTRTIQRYNSYRLRGIPHYFPLTPPLCLFTALSQNILKTSAVSDSLFYRLEVYQKSWTS